MSGGRATIGQRKGKEMAHQAGDITATHPDGHVLTDKWFIECKRVRDMGYEAGIFKNQGLLAKYWAEATAQALLHKRTPMLIARQNLGETIVVVPCAYQLAAGAGHYVHLNPQGYLLRSMLLKADFYTFDSMIAKPFVADAFQLPFGSFGPKRERVRIDDHFERDRGVVHRPPHPSEKESFAPRKRVRIKL
jgi:hypothetical protein